MLRCACLILLAVFPGLCVATTPTPLQREAELRNQVESLLPANTSPTAEEARFAYAELLTFTLERDFPTAIDLLNGLLVRAHALQPPDEGALASIEHTLAHACFYAGAPQDRVESLLLSALSRRRALFGEQSDEVLTTRANLAVFYGQTGRPDLSELELRAVALARHAQDPDANTTLQTRTNWSIALGRLGRFDEAEVVLRDVVAHRAKLIGSNNPDLTHQLNLLAWVLYSTGRSAEAVPVLEHVVTLREASLGPDASGTLTARNNLAATLERLGHFDKAETLIRADLARVSAQPTPSEREIADYHYALGKLALHRGTPNTSVNEFSRAATVYASPTAQGWRDTEARDLELTLRWLALALHTRARPNDNEAARTAAAQWLDLLETQFRLHLGYTSEADRLGFAAHERPFDLPATLGDADLLARAVVRLQGLILDSLIEDAALAAAATDPATTTLLERYRKALSAPATEIAKDASPDPLQLPLIDRLEKELAQHIGGSRLPRQALHTEPSAVLAALPTGASLVNFVRYAIPDPRDPTALPEHYLALLGTTSGWQIVPLGPAAAIDELIERYRVLTTANGPASWAADLRAKILDPVRAALDDTATTLCIVPDGALHRVNFATLPEADGKTFAIQHHRYLWLDSARELLRPHAASTPRSDKPTVRVLASPTLSGRLANLPLLPGATREIDALRQFSPDAVVHMGDAATPAAALAAPAPQILHFAAHGFWALDDADHRSSLQQAGIALAGPDGLLTAAQIATADWNATDLVVISACGSGQGAVRDGEGVLGLRRALARSGVHHALLSLWPIDDKATGELLNHFYTILATGISPVDAYEQTLRAELPRLAARDGISTALRRAGALIMVGAP